MFKRSELRMFLEALKNHAQVLSFVQAHERCMLGQPGTALLRHDIDIDMIAAMDMAAIEADLGMTATYFFLTGCDTYNLASAANRRRLRKMVADGFEVALHFDPTLYPDASDDALQEAVWRESAWLSDLAGVEVRSVSLHNPSVHGCYPVFQGFINAYAPALFQPESYLSDSCMGFRGKDPFAFVAQAKSRGVQVVLHPFHYSEEGAGYPELYSALVRRMTAVIDENMQVNNTYAAQMNGESLWDRVRRA